MASTSVTYTGLTATSPILHFTGSMKRGCRASAFLIYLPVGTHSLSGGTLTIADSATGASVVLQECLPGQSHRLSSDHRCADEYVVATIYDRRKHWERQSSAGEFNRRNTRGEIVGGSLTTLTCKQVVESLLDAMGETGYDTSAVATTFFPHVKYNGPPVLALEKLLSRCGYDLVLKNDNTVAIVQLGSGSDLNTSSGYLDSLGGTTNEGPQKITLVGGPTIWHSYFTTRAIGLEADGSTELIASLSYTPSAGWTKEDPRLFAGVTASSRSLAHQSVFRWYEVHTLTAGYSGNYTPNGASEAGTGVEQLLPFVAMQGEYGPHTSPWTLLAAEIHGQWYPYSDHPENTGSCVRYEGGFSLDQDSGVIKLEQPVWKYGALNGDTDEADLYLLAAHRFRASDGTYDCYTRDKTLSGTGPAVELPFPEIFLARYWQSPACDTGTEVTNETDIQSEADAILTSWGTAVSESVPRRLRDMIGIRAIDCDGVISAVEWSAGTRRLPRTKITLGSLEDVMSRLLWSGGTAS